MTARLSYGLGALVDLAAAERPVKGAVLAGRHGVSKGFLENILAELRRAGIVASKRGGHGGYWLARPAGDITVADVIRTLDGATAWTPAPATTACGPCGCPSRGPRCAPRRPSPSTRWRPGGLRLPT
ncbi:MAG: Rrf2 family transcriptional regulator [Acidimicrobiia bacterium]